MMFLNADYLQAINYKTNAIDAVVPVEDIGLESSDSSDDFAGGDSGDESDDDAEGFPATGKRQKTTPTQQMTPLATPVKKTSKNSTVDKNSTQTPKTSKTLK